MMIQVHGNHITVTEALRTHVEDKIGRLNRYFDSPSDQEVRVTMSIEHEVHRVEVRMTFHGIMIHAEETSNDMYTSIDLAVDRFRHQLQKHKEKLNQQFHRRGKPTRVKDVSDLMESTNEERPKLVHTKRISAKPMGIEEAALQLETFGREFFVFTNEESNQLNVLYRQEDGDFALIEPC